ncbi:hypothetical protein TRVL_05913 [Trypanosoma vivax]|uniref:Uncharacterized protein n=1 Tax=Trypanosoma vivax (strain Y486) TaxID=1055687 RepID=G0U5J9_TRYVY|nr:hypothetical protein TRVL_05913 [Trypanosoma vivax]CCC51150.1 conserved hypothetical protein [Trypanosoma vivax Y486]
MLCRTTLHCNRITSAISPSLLRAAFMLRWGMLGLQHNTETNMFVLAEGEPDGLQRDMRLEMYALSVRLVQLPDTHNGLGPEGSLTPPPRGDLSAITAAMESALLAGESGMRTLRPTLLSCSYVNAEHGSCVVPSGDSVGERGRVCAADSGEGTPQLAEWLFDGQQVSPPLMENGIVFPSAHSAGHRHLRAARQAFALLVESELSAFNGTEQLPIVDVSDFDCSFSRVATQIAVERNLVPEKHFHVSFVPLTAAAEATATGDDTITSLLRIVTRSTSGWEADPLHAVQARYFALGSFTVLSKAACTGQSKTFDKKRLSLRLAQVVSRMNRGGKLLVNVVPAALEDQLELQSMVRALVVEAISRAERWAVVIDEIFPTADCRAIAVSFLLSLD